MEAELRKTKKEMAKLLQFKKAIINTVDDDDPEERLQFFCSDYSDTIIE